MLNGGMYCGWFFFVDSNSDLDDSDYVRFLEIDKDVRERRL